MPHLESENGISWYYELEGEGTPLLFLHGWGVDLRIWRQQTKYFSDYYKVAAVDLPGHGKSTWQPVTVQQTAEGILTLMEKLGIRNFGIVGSSLGGLVGLKILEVAPERISSLVLVGSQPKFAKTEDYPYGMDVARIRKLGMQLMSNYPSIVNIFFRSLFTKEERQSRRFRWVQTFRKNIQLPAKEALGFMLDVLEKEDLRPGLGKIRAPVQVINGTDDYICNKEVAEYFQRTIPHARLDWFPQCGHFPFISKPHEFNAVLHDFLKKTYA